MQSFELGLSRANFRDYAASRQSICSAEPRWLQDELSSVNGLLSRWLERTGAGYDGDWTSDDLRLLETGAETLGPLLQTHARNLEELEQCSFSDERAFPELHRRGEALIARARARADQAKPIIAWRTAKQALEIWSQEQPLRQLHAKRACPDRVVPGRAEIYYAVERDGQVRWLFCDDARVISAGGNKPEFQMPDGLSRRERRRIKARKYLEAAEAYPSARIDRPPSLPPRPTGAASAAP